MAGRGGFMAITKREQDLLLAKPKAKRWEFVHDGMKAKFSAYMDKAWVPIHRALSDGFLHGTMGEYPLTMAVLRDLLICRTQTDDFVYLKNPAEVVEISQGFRGLGRKRLEERLATLRGKKADTAPWGLNLVPEEIDYVWPYYQRMRSFYRRAAAAKLAVIFYWG